MANRHFYWKRQRYEITDRIRVGGREFLLSDRLSSGLRSRHLAYDRVAGPKGALCVVERQAHSKAAWQRVEVLQRLSQQNAELPQIREFYRSGSEIITVEKWIEGQDLRWWIQRMRKSGKRQLGTPEAIRLFRQLAHGLSHLHDACGLVHADIKPANLIISNATKKLVLIDFGSAWQTERTSRRAEGDGRSDIYGAPEFLRGDMGVNYRADYFSLAVTCFETLTLQLPYDGLGGRAGLPQNAAGGDSMYMPASELSAERHQLADSTWQSIDTLLRHSLQLNRDLRPRNKSEFLNGWDSAVAACKQATEIQRQTGFWDSILAYFRR